VTDELPDVVQRIGDAGRLEVTARLREALAAEAVTAGVALTGGELDHEAAEAVVHADGALWRRALAGAAAGELGLGLGEAIHHPAVLEAHRLVGAPPYPADPPPAPEAPPPAPEAPPPGPEAPPPGPEAPPPGPEAGEAEAVRVAAIHLGGIEALRAGERDLELRISSAGLDVLKRSSGAPIGRLEWAEVQSVDLPRSRRGLRPGRRPYELHVATGRGRASFQLPGITEEQLRDHLEPMLARARGTV
jgi:hypothetical protein